MRHPRVVGNHVKKLPAPLQRADDLCPLLLPTGCESNYYKYPLLLPRGCDRAAVKRSIREQYGVMLSGEVYARPLHTEPALREFADGPLPVAEDICSRHVCLPIHSDMTDAEVEIVIRAVTEALTA